MTIVKSYGDLFNKYSAIDVRGMDVCPTDGNLIALTGGIEDEPDIQIYDNRVGNIIKSITRPNKGIFQSPYIVSTLLHLKFRICELREMES
mgnify:FL=1